MKRTKCYTYFRIVGNFNPEIITTLLCLNPYNSWKIGDTRKNGAKYDFANWDFGYCDKYDIDVDNQMRTTINPLLAKADILNEIKRKYDVDFYLEIVPTIFPDDILPCLSPSLDVMKFCCDTQTKIDIDLYLEEENSNL